jgi:prepilin-type processing-associated H-X9-DG protein
MKRIVLAAMAALSVSACATAGDRAAEAQKSLIGKSRGDILSCMGAPLQRSAADGVEVWSYAGGGQTVGMASGGFYAAKSFNCTANVAFADGRVRSINYSGNTGRPFTPLEACDGLVQGC